VTLVPVFLGLLTGLGLLVAGSLGWTLYRAPRLERAILRVLADAAEPLYGLDLRTRLGESATLYVHLQRLEERGLIRSHEEPAPAHPTGRIRRRLYTLTSAGRTQAVTR
jgi:DNA-binding PadR family transcriptional regulator